jgi:phosphate transport system substrate-binding protein
VQRCVPVLGQFLAALLFLLPTARAGTHDVLLFIQGDLDPAVANAARSSGDPAMSRIADADAACAEQPADTPRLAMVVGILAKSDVEACGRTATADVLAVTIGYQAIALVTPAKARAFAVHSTDLYHAMAAHAGTPGVPMAWRDVNAKLPSLPFGLLAPPAGSTASRLFDTYVMEPACREPNGTKSPMQATSQSDSCTALRSAPSMVRRKGDDHELAVWAASAPDGQLAVVTLAELRKLDHAVVPLPLDDVLPTAADIVSGRYPAAEPVSLLVVVPRDVTAERRDAARQAVFEFMSERGIGPDGSLTQAGLIPLAPAERVASRVRAVAFVQHP